MRKCEVIIAGDGLARRQVMIALEQKGINTKPVNLSISELENPDFSILKKSGFLVQTSKDKYHAKVVVLAVPKKKCNWNVDGFSHYRNTDILWSMDEAVKLSKKNRIGIVGSGKIILERARKMIEMGHEIVKGVKWKQEPLEWASDFYYKRSPCGIVFVELNNYSLTKKRVQEEFLHHILDEIEKCLRK